MKGALHIHQVRHLQRTRTASGCLIMRCHNIWLSQISPHAAAFDLQGDPSLRVPGSVEDILEVPWACTLLLQLGSCCPGRLGLIATEPGHPVSPLSEFAICAEFAFFCSGLSHEDIGDHSERGPLEAAAARVRGLVWN